MINVDMMSDEEEEYHFTDIEEEPDIYEPTGTDLPPAAAPRPPVGQLIVSFIVFAVLVYAGYHYVKGYFEAKIEKPKQTITKPQEIRPIKPVVQSKPIEPSVSVEPEVTKAQFNELSQKVDEMNSRADSINTDIGNLRTRFDHIEASVAGVSNKLNDMNNSIQQLAERLRPKKAPVIVKKKMKRRRKRYVPRDRYFLKAAIPGRAWLKTKAGKTLTVSVGSPVAGYGVVRAIDAAKGMVRTSSGAIIRYGVRH